MNLIINIIYNEKIIAQAIFQSCGTTKKAYELFRPIAELYNNMNKNRIKSDMLKMAIDVYGKPVAQLSNEEKAVILLQEAGAMFQSVEEITPLLKANSGELKIPVFVESESLSQIHIIDIIQPSEADGYTTISLDCSKGMVEFLVFESRDVKGLKEEAYESIDEYGLDLDNFDSIYIDDVEEVIQNLPLISQGKLITRIEGD